MSGIGALSRATGCPIETIRYYEKIGLLKAPPRTDGRHRIYGPEHYQRLTFIRQSRDLGFALADIRALIELSEDGSSPCVDALGVVRKHLVQVEAKLAKLQTIQKQLLSIAATCEFTCLGSGSINCTIVEAVQSNGRSTPRGCCS